MKAEAIRLSVEDGPLVGVQFAPKRIFPASTASKFQRSMSQNLSYLEQNSNLWTASEVVIMDSAYWVLVK